jgi:porin
VPTKAGKAGNMRGNLSHPELAATILLLALVSLCVRPVLAQSPPTSQLQSWLGQATLTGDWGGVRTRLENLGVEPRAEFFTESAANPIGGQAQAARYTQEIDLGADLDLNRLVALPHGKVQITLTDDTGHSLSNDAIGNQFQVQELFVAGQSFRLSELNYQQSLFSDKISFEVGWAPVGDSFAHPMMFCAFQNAAFCGHASAMTINSGAQNFPFAQWGAHLKVRPAPTFYLATGLYQVNSNEVTPDKGFNIFSGTGMFLPIELGWLPDWSGALPGAYKLGSYYNSSPTPDVLTDVNGRSAGLTGAPFETRAARWGAYLIVNQTIYRFRPQSRRSLRIGGLAGMGDPETARFGYFASGGWLLQGPFSHREEDFLAMAVAYARTNPRLTQFQEDRDAVSPGSVGIQTYESIVEIGYGAWITPWLLLQPNLQYVINPGGTGNISNAFVLGIHTDVTF